MTPSVAQILELVAQECRVSVADLLGDDRSRGVVRPRQLAMWLMRQTTFMSFPQIGEAMGRDHSTVVHGVRRITRERGNKSTLALTDRLLSILRDDPRQARLIA